MPTAAPVPSVTEAARGPKDARLHQAPRTADIVGGLSVMLVVAVVVLSFLTHDRQRDLLANLPLAVLALAFSVMGYLVARRQPLMAPGWTLLAIGDCMLLTLVGWCYSVIYFRVHEGVLPLALVALVLAFLLYGGVALFPVLLLLFPRGELSSRRWGWAMWIYLIAIGIAVSHNMLIAVFTGTGQHVSIAAQGYLQSSARLTGVVGTLAKITNLSGVAPIFPVFYLACIGRLVVSYRGSSREGRQQLKWLAGGGILTLAGLLIENFAPSNGFPGPGGLLLTAFAALATCALPVGLGVGILKYRLYDVDRLISRTLSYLIVTGILIGVYVGLVTVATRVLPFSSPLGVAVSTLAAVALFNPLRRRVQRLVDRRFNRARYDAEATVDAFARRVRDDVDLAAVSTEFVRAVESAVEPTHVSLWLRPTSSRS
jgi:hypothetical protein